MNIKFKTILFKLDFLGITPQLKILNNKSYKSIFSSLLSLLIIIFSIAFVIYSFIDFINQTPMIDFYKCNDFDTNRTISMSDSFIMFQILYKDNNDIVKNNISFISLYYSSEEYKFINLKVEPCKYGKNIDLKHQELFKNIEKKEGVSIGEFFCINLSGISLFQNPNNNNMKDNYIRLIIKKNEKDTNTKNYAIQIVTENDIISHNNKENPIIPYYYYNIINFYNYSETLFIRYDFDYIKYESDTGFILGNSNIVNAIGFSSLSYSDYFYSQNSSFSAVIDFGIKKSSYDYYKRTYRKFQSFLADTMSLINLIITIFKLLTDFLLGKKMNKDIIRKILMVNNCKGNKEKFLTIKKDVLMKNLKDNSKDKNFSEFDENQNSKQFLEEPNNIKLNDIKLKERNIKTLKNLKFYNIIKSFFCFKDIKTKLIDLCNKIINEDICIDRILSRLYNLEKIYSLIGNEKYTLNRKEEFRKINNYLFQINYEIKRNINNKSEKNKKENTQIK